MLGNGERLSNLAFTVSFRSYANVPFAQRKGTRRSEATSQGMPDGPSPSTDTTAKF